jgi:oxygen-independent coproporphyrinogen III oxidase
MPPMQQGTSILLYIHIPFCDSKCHYCAFNSYVDKFEQIAAYMHALEQQLIHELERFNATPQSISSIFIGGGTPSTVAPELYESIFERIRPYLQTGAEITTEANPNSATEHWLQGMYALGCTRVSFGVQSFHDTKLKFLGREHSSDQAITAVNTAHKIGFKHLSIDLIYATKMDTKAILQNDLDIAFSLPINHLSAYALTIEKNTLFEQHPDAAKERLELSEFFINTVKSKGFEQYEISNFGTYRCRHNIGYWQLDNYMGVGSGAVGMLANTRLYPSTDIEYYIKNPLDITEEKLSEEEKHTEAIFLGLRSCVGVDSASLSTSERKQAQLLIEENKLLQLGERLYNPDFLLSDEIALFLQS